MHKEKQVSVLAYADRHTRHRRGYGEICSRLLNHQCRQNIPEQRREDESVRSYGQRPQTPQKRIDVGQLQEYTRQHVSDFLISCRMHLSSCHDQFFFFFCVCVCACVSWKLSSNRGSMHSSDHGTMKAYASPTIPWSLMFSAAIRNELTNRNKRPRLTNPLRGARRFGANEMAPMA